MTTYREALISQYYQFGRLFPLCWNTKHKPEVDLLIFFKDLAYQLTDDEICAASNDAINAARLVANKLANELNQCDSEVVKYKIEPKTLSEIKAQIIKAADSGNMLEYFNVFSDMACVEILLPKSRELYYHVGTLLHDLYGQHAEEGDLYKHDMDNPNYPQYIYTTILNHIVKVKLQT